jgi:SepF-like predicted cell division protein (DUF552 family)
MGKKYSCKTAAMRFSKLANLIKEKNSSIKLSDITEAFSVEALTKEFYNELFLHLDLSDIGKSSRRNRQKRVFQSSLACALLSL